MLFDLHVATTSAEESVAAARCHDVSGR